MRLKILIVAVGLAALAMASPASSQSKQTIVTITATEPMTTDNPYGESSSPVYSLWCHTYGCLGRYDHTKKQLVGIIALGDIALVQGEVSGGAMDAVPVRCESRRVQWARPSTSRSTALAPV